MAQPSLPTLRFVTVRAENEYANVISQVGGKYVSVPAIMTNQNTGRAALPPPGWGRAPGQLVGRVAVVNETLHGLVEQRLRGTSQRCTSGRRAVVELAGWGL
ncbi:MAG TPA: hypothetical protein VL984_11845 [Acidimicrobiales bacterium]|nr:hypothetical protein [Acidimicrobiales bacterium]